MLRSVALKNAGLFSKHTEVTCDYSGGDDGGCLAILVGQNATGKSMVFECIRRCLPIQGQWKMYDKAERPEIKPRILNEQNPYYLNCTYDYNVEDFKPMVEKLEQLQCSKLIENFLQKVPVEGCIKCTVGLSKLPNEELKRFVLVRLDESKNGTLAFVMNKSNIFVYLSNQTNLNPINNAQDIESNKVDKVKMDEEKDKQNTEECLLDILLKKLDANVHCIYPHRGIGPMEDSQSAKMERGSMNYKQATINSDIINRMLNRPDNKEFCQKYCEILLKLWPNCPFEVTIKRSEDKSIVKEQFLEELHRKLNDIHEGREDLDGLITYVAKKLLEISEEPELQMKDNEAQGSGDVPLLKIPEGVYEVILFSMVTADTLIKNVPATLIYDEPSRCMHPSLVERMRSYVSKITAEKKICILLTTHSSSFVSLHTWSHIYHFKREKEVSKMPVLSCTQVESDKFNVRNIRYWSRETLRGLLFSRRLLLVEGERDVVFVNELLHQLETRHDQVDENKEALGSITLLELGGCGNASKVAEFCSHVGIKYGVVLDRDAGCPKGTEERKCAMEFKHATLKLGGEREKLYKLANKLTEFLNKLYKQKESDTEFSSHAPKYKELIGSINECTDLLEKVNEVCMKDKINDQGEIEALYYIKETLQKSSLFDIASVNNLRVARNMFKKTWPGSLPRREKLIKDQTNISKPEKSFLWTSGDLEQAINSRDDPRNNIGPLLKVDYDGIAKSQFIWYISKDPTSDLVHFTTQQVSDLVKFLLQNPSNDLADFIKYLKNLDSTVVQPLMNNECSY